MQAIRRAHGLSQPFLPEADTLAQIEPVAGGALAGRDDPDSGLAAEAAEADGERRRHACQCHCGLRMVRQARGVADQPVPEAPDRLFQFEEVQHSSPLGENSAGDLDQPGADLRLVGQRLDNGGHDGLLPGQAGDDQARGIDDKAGRDPLLDVLPLERA